MKGMCIFYSLSITQRYHQAHTLTDTYRAYQVIDKIIRGNWATSPSQTDEKRKVKAKVLAMVEEKNSDMEEDKMESNLKRVEEVDASKGSWHGLRWGESTGRNRMSEKRRDG